MIEILMKPVSESPVTEYRSPMLNYEFCDIFDFQFLIKEEQQKNDWFSFDTIRDSFFLFLTAYYLSHFNVR